MKWLNWHLMTKCTGANPAYPLMSDMKQIYIDAFEGVVRDYYPASK